MCDYDWKALADLLETGPVFLDEAEEAADYIEEGRNTAKKFKRLVAENLPNVLSGKHVDFSEPDMLSLKEDLDIEKSIHQFTEEVFGWQ